MIQLCLPLLILSAGGPTRTEALFPQATEVRRWDFESGDDANFDRWPDDWTRRKGAGYPLYLTVKIVADDPPRETGGQVLRMELDGGAALVFSPPIEVSPLFSYVLRGHLKTRGLQHDVAYASVLFYDRDRQLLEAHDSPHQRQVDEWTPFQIGPVTPRSDQVRWAAIALHLRPTDQEDLLGEACFDDLWLGQLPRVSLETNSPHNVYTLADTIQVTCLVSGITSPNPRVRFELLDLAGQVLLQQEQEMTPDVPNQPRVQAFSGSASWSPAMPPCGFYLIRAYLLGASTEPITTSLAVVQPLKQGRFGEFGWSLPRGDSWLSLKALDSLLGRVGIHWVKFPLWYSDQQPGRADELAWFAERMSARDIQLIGVLDQPPPELHALFGEERQLPVASVFAEPEIWHPAVDPVMTRLSLKVRWWQLGGDRDVSFVNYPNLEARIADLRKEFNRFGQQINLGVPWRSMDETPASADPPWSFLSYLADPPLAAEELAHYFPRHSTSPAKRWLILQPLSKSQYTLETRVRDLVDRMLTAKMQQVAGIFVPDPFDAEHGLMTPHGTPSEMLPAWRTTATMISGKQHLGSITLPHGSQNQIFTDGTEAVMVVWSETPVTESVYLGENVKQVDVWGREAEVLLSSQEGWVRQEIPVGKLPTFVTGVKPELARWQMAFRFQPDKIASIFGREQSISYSFQNTFDQGVGGSVQLHVPQVWDAAPTSTHFKLFAGEQREQGLRIALQPNANSGGQPVRIDFDITADRSYRFSVYRTIHVGLGDILIDTATQLDQDGNLVIDVQLTNTTDQFASFNCLLSSRLRRRERRQVFNLGRGATSIIFVMPKGADLLGETLWLRVEEIGGARILNHQIIAQE